MNPHRGSDFNEFLAKENLMTPTPRTDAIAHRGLDSVAYIAEMTSFAREFEAELSQAREWSSKLADVADDMRSELAAERALADRLAALLQQDREGYGHHKVDDGCDCCDCEYLRPIDEALALWKEARSGTV